MFKFDSAALIAAVVLSSVMPIYAHASFFDDDMDATESAQAVVKCAEEAKGLFLGNYFEYLATATGKHEKVSAKVDTKRYTFQVISGGGFGPPPTQGNTLFVDVKVTQLPDEIIDGHATIEWSCTLQKN